MVQSVLTQNRLERNGSFLCRLGQCDLRVAQIGRILGRFQTSHVICRYDRRYRLTVTFDDRPFATVFGATEHIRKSILGFSVLITSQVLIVQWEAASRLSACGARRGTGDRPDVGEHAAGVPGWEGSYQRRGAVELDAAPASDLAPGELARVPFDEGFGFRRDVEVLVEAGVRLADLGVSALDK